MEGKAKNRQQTTSEDKDSALSNPTSQIERSRGAILEIDREWPVESVNKVPTYLPTYMTRAPRGRVPRRSALRAKRARLKACRRAFDVSSELQVPAAARAAMLRTS